MRRLILIVIIVGVLASGGAPAAARRGGGGRMQPFWSADGRWLLVNSYLETANGLWAYDTTDWSVPPRLLVSFDPDSAVMVPTARSVYDVAFSADGTRMATAELANGVILWDMATFAEIGHFDAAGGAVAFNGDGTLLAAEHAVEGVVRVFDIASGAVVYELINTHLWTMAFGMTDSGEVLATGGCLNFDNGCQQGAVWLWDATNGDLLDIIYSSAGWVTDVAFSPAGNELALSGAFNLVGIWSFATRTLAEVSPAVLDQADPTATADGVAYNATGELLVYGLSNGRFIVWDRGEQAERSNQRLPNWIAGVTFAPEANQFATGSIGGGVRVWDALTGELMVELLADFFRATE